MFEVIDKSLKGGKVKRVIFIELIWTGALFYLRRVIYG